MKKKTNIHVSLFINFINSRLLLKVLVTNKRLGKITLFLLKKLDRLLKEVLCLYQLKDLSDIEIKFFDIRSLKPNI